MQDLGTLEPTGQFSYSQDINDSDQIVGRSVGSDNYVHPFLWTDSGGMTAIPADTEAGAIAGLALKINNAGDVAGHLFFENNDTHQFFWSPRVESSTSPRSAGPRGSFRT